jgi:hypothetical protein
MAVRIAFIVDLRSTDGFIAAVEHSMMWSVTLFFSIFRTAE